MTAGYSSTPQRKKLGIVEGTRLDVVGASSDWSFETPADDALAVSAPEPADVVLAFIRSAAELAPVLAEHADRIRPAGALWIAWPRKAAGHQSDVDENFIRDSALAIGLVDVKVAAIDTDWSGLKLVWRRENR